MKVIFDIPEPLVLELNSVANDKGLKDMQEMTKAYWRYKIEAKRQGILEEQLRVQLEESAADLDELYKES